MHMTDNSYAAPWQPIYNNGEAANVRPSYYALAAMAQLLGSGNGTTRLAPLATQNSYVRAYAAYANDDLSSLVVINAQQVNSSATDKGSIDFAISLPDLKGQTLYLSYLNAAGADVTQNVTWNGLSFESDSVGTATTAQDQSGQTVVLDSNGAGTITVRDSQAVIANLGARLGSLPVDVANSTSSSGSGHSGSGSGKNGHTSSASTSGATRTVSTSASATAIASTTAANVQAAAASGSVTSSSAGVSVTAKSASSKTIMLTDKTLFTVVLMALVCIFTS
ncbi:glycoside hydrolase family 79 protein, partial [Aureobasidium melanogenum]